MSYAFTHETPGAVESGVRASATAGSSQKAVAHLSNPERALELLERHAEKIEFNKFGCWNWTACTAGGLGYGNLWCHIEQRMVRAHRAFYEAFFGKLADGRILCHKCDNPLCCNPNHMFVGTHYDNIADMMSKGRAHFQRNGAKPATNIRARNNGFTLDICRGGVRHKAKFKTFCEAVIDRAEFIRKHEFSTKTG